MNMSSNSVSPQGTGGSAQEAYAGLMRSHQEAQLRQALEDHSRVDVLAYHQLQQQRQQEEAERQAQAHFYQQQREEQERRIEEERYHLQQLHHRQQQQQQVYMDPYAHPQAHQPHLLEMGMDAMALGGIEMYPPTAHMSMNGGYPHPPPHHHPQAQHHIVEGVVDSPVLGYTDSGAAGYHPQNHHQHHSHSHPHGHPHHPPPETQHLEAVGSPVSPYSLGYPHTPLGYPYAETMAAGGYGMVMGRQEDGLKWESGLDGELGLWDTNTSILTPNMNIIGLGVGGAAG
ncbi:hypothetical protein R3P38DRAFT_3153536 [Favolaschia claudopus]|uniref:Uncharacterized protein n=1 Tax=Favolaschia claudopus TaxID=2862362 RepID=A0AAV9YZW9_9AGAR